MLHFISVKPWTANNRDTHNGCFWTNANDFVYVCVCARIALINVNVCDRNSCSYQMEIANLLWILKSSQQKIGKLSKLFFGQSLIVVDVTEKKLYLCRFMAMFCFCFQFFLVKHWAQVNSSNAVPKKTKAKKNEQIVRVEHILIHLLLLRFIMLNAVKRLSWQFVTVISVFLKSLKRRR